LISRVSDKILFKISQRVIELESIICELTIKKSLRLGTSQYYFNSNDWKVADTMSKSREESFLRAELVGKALRN